MHKRNQTAFIPLISNVRYICNTETSLKSLLPRVSFKENYTQKSSGSTTHNASAFVVYLNKKGDFEN